MTAGRPGPTMRRPSRPTTMSDRFHLFHRKPDLASSALVDLVTFIGAGLVENGLTVTHGPDIPGGAVVLCFEGTYPDEASIRRIRSEGALGCLVTEIIAGGKFYDWMGHWDGSVRWQRFEQCAGYFDFVWTTVPQNLEALNRYGRARFIEIGYSPLVPVPEDVEPDIDFSYFGKRNPYRDKILNELARHFTVVVPDGTSDVAVRDRIVRRTRFNIMLKQSPDWPLPSATRLASILQLERAVVRDWTPCQTRQSSAVPTAAEGQDFVEYCNDALKQDWRAFRGDAIDAFKRLRMKDIIEVVLRETLPAAAAGAKPQRDTSGR